MSADDPFVLSQGGFDIAVTGEADHQLRLRDLSSGSYARSAAGAALPLGRLVAAGTTHSHARLTSISAPVMRNFVILASMTFAPRVANERRMNARWASR